MMRMPIIMGVCATLAGCVSQPPAGSPAVTESQAAQNRARPYDEGQAALQNFATSGSCTAPSGAVVVIKIGELEHLVTSFHTVGNLPYLEREAIDRHTALSFGYADEALRMKCFDDADQIYRHLIQFYTGQAYSAIRDRAMVGVDDVRAARG